MAYAVPGIVASQGESVEITDEDAQAVLSAMTTTPDATRQTTIETLVTDLKNAGVWSKLDCLYILAAHDAQAARVDWKNPAVHSMDEVGTPGFTVDRGYEVAVDNSGLRSSTFNPANDMVQGTPTSASCGIWWVVFAEGVGHSGFSILETEDDNNHETKINFNTVGTMHGGPTLAPSSNAFWNEVASAGHFTITNSTGDTPDSLAYKDGVSLGSPDSTNDTQTATAFNDGPLQILMHEHGETLSGAAEGGATEGAMYLGGLLTGTEIADLHNALNSYMTSVGAA